MKKLLAILLLLLIPVAAAEVRQEIVNAEEITVKTEVTSSINVQKTGDDFNVEYLKAQLFFFPKTEYNQEITSSVSDPDSTKSNDFVLFSWEGIQPQHLNYGLFNTVVIKNDFPRVREKISYPIKVPDGFAKYLQPSEVIDSDHPLIVEQATRLAEGEDDLFLIVSKLAGWTKQTIDYNLSTLTAEVSQKASWTLENRKGVCDEMTSLFVGMLRALGIPAKFVSGLSYTNSPLFPNQWGAHGWAEVYFPEIGWIPFDPTFGEYGWVDPGHIKMRESLDPKEPSTKFEWKGSSVDVDASPLSLTGEVEKIGRPTPPIITMSASGAKDDVGIGTYNLAVLNITNNQDYYVSTEVTMAKVEELDIFGPLKKQVILKPLQTKQLFWKVKVHEDLNPSYRYEIPLGYFTIRNESHIGYFTVVNKGAKYNDKEMEKLRNALSAVEEKKITTELQLDCSPEQTEFFQNTENKIICKVKNAGNVALSANVCLEGSCEQADISINQEQTVSFPVKYTRPGTVDYLITATAGDLKQQDLVQIKMLDLPLVQISELSYPTRVKYDQMFEIGFVVESLSFSNPKNLHITLEDTVLLYKFNLDELEENQEFILTIHGNQLKREVNEITIKVTYEDDEQRQFELSDTFNITIGDMTFMQKIKQFFTRLFG